ncbi:MAG: RecX family transcriptional regulator [Thermoleophilaceae bacterium]|nr:RecX family transcriptional regulator [Thermoleophilaceae bacterium]
MDEEAKAVELAYRAISRRDKTVAEVRSFLEQRAIEPDAIEHALSELRDADILDDARFAERFAEDKRLIERWGRERIERELCRRGVPAGLAEVAVEDQGRETELDAALSLLADKVAPPEGDRERDKAWRLLVRKGYEPELAYEAVREHERREAA